MKTILLAGAVALGASSAFAAEKYVLDASHSQVVFTFEHLGYSTMTGMFSGFDGEIMFDEADPAQSSVSVSIPLEIMYTGWEERDTHFMSEDFFAAEEGDMVTFTSTGIEVTGENTALITGDLTMNDITKSVVLDTVMNQKGDHPMAGKPWMGFSATTSVLRSDFGVDMFAPYVSDEIKINLSVEAMKAE